MGVLWKRSEREAERWSEIEAAISAADSRIRDLNSTVLWLEKDNERLRDRIVEAEAAIAQARDLIHGLRGELRMEDVRTAPVCDRSHHADNPGWVPLLDLLEVRADEYPCAVQYTTGEGWVDTARGLYYLRGDTEARMFLDAHPLAIAQGDNGGEVSPNFLVGMNPTTCNHRNRFCPHKGVRRPWVVQADYPVVSSDFEVAGERDGAE